MKKAIFISLITTCLFYNTSFAADPAIKELKENKNEPTEFSADNVVYDEKNNKIIAIGNVEAIQGGSILIADRLEYDMITDKIIAKDNVVISYSDGKTVFSDRVDVTSDFKTGIASNILIKNSDGSSFTAKELRSREDEKMIMRRASYTPCDLCEGKDPSWKISARKAVFDQKEEEVAYNNASLDLFGTPIMYFPWFNHSTKKEDSKTGFLPPKFGSKGNLGFMLATPFFIHANDQHKFTLTPTYMTKENPMISGRYHGLTKNTEMTFNGSFIEQKDGQERYYFHETTNTHLNSNFRFRSSIYNISDDTFLRVYDLPNQDEPWLMNEVALDGFWHNYNLNVSYLYYNDLRRYINDKNMPVILPSINFNYYGTPSKFGGFHNFKFNSLSLTREGTLKNEQEYHRYTVMTDYNLPLKGSLGEQYKLTASLRGDLYDLNNTVGSDNKVYSGIKGRLYPELSFETSYPFVRTDSVSTQIIKPTVVFATSPNIRPLKEIPNEDSRDFELSENNILTTDRYTGYDKVETGTRVNYGLSWNIYAHQGYSFTSFIGQSYRFTDTNYFPENSGLENDLSDYVGAIGFSGSRYFNLDYRFRLQKEDLKLKRSELFMRAGNSFLRTNINYLFIESSSSSYSNFNDREELKIGLNSNLTQYIRASAYTRYNLITDKTVETNFGIGYEDECLGLYLNLKQDFTKDRDYKGDTSIMLTFNLKTLGTLRSGSLSVQ